MCRGSLFLFPPHEKACFMFTVKESPLHGHGLFASRLIPAETVLGHLVTESVPDHELDGPHVLWVDGEQPVKVTCDFRFINHSDEPNAAYFDDLTVVSLREIQPGEEILHDYLGDDAGCPESAMGFETAPANDPGDCVPV